MDRGRIPPCCGSACNRITRGKSTIEGGGVRLCKRRIIDFPGYSHNYVGNFYYNDFSGGNSTLKKHKAFSVQENY